MDKPDYPSGLVLYEPVLQVLERRRVRYVVVGGVATVLHGHLRFTADLDLVIDLAEPQVRAAIDALLEAGLRPRLPVDPYGLADADVRQTWVRERGMVAFSLYDPARPTLSVDLLVEAEPAFAELERQVVRLPLATLDVPVASIDDLIAMKRRAGRPMDLIDVAELEAIKALHDG
jgi:hypothetical protein